MNPSGLLHSEIHGSKLICSSPWLIAAYHVFLRLLVPRHSPCALCSLTNYACSHDCSFCYPCFCNCNFILSFAVSYFVVQFSRYKNELRSSSKHPFRSLIMTETSLREDRLLDISKPVGLMVGSSGLEPPTSRLSGVRSNHLSYEPMFQRFGFLPLFPGKMLVEMRRIELLTPCVQGRCSPS